MQINEDDPFKFWVILVNYRLDKKSLFNQPLLNYHLSITGNNILHEVHYNR